MFSGLFGYDNTIARFFRTVGYIWYIHLLWLITSLPLITLGASTTALHYTMMKLQKEEGYPTSNFFHALKRDFKESTILFFIYAIGGIAIGCDLIIGNQLATHAGRLLWILAWILAVPYFLSLLYVFAVEARFNNTVWNTMKYAFGLSIKNMKETIQLVLLSLLMVYINTWLVLCNFITLVFGVGLLIYLFSFYYNRIFEPYIQKYSEGEGEYHADRD